MRLPRGEKENKYDIISISILLNGVKESSNGVPQIKVIEKFTLFQLNSNPYAHPLSMNFMLIIHDACSFCSPITHWCFVKNVINAGREIDVKINLSNTPMDHLKCIFLWIVWLFFFFILAITRFSFELVLLFKDIFTVFQPPEIFFCH